MKATRKKLLKPRREEADRQAVRWQEDFADYIRTECHLAANTVEAYRRDMAKFFEWLGSRRFQSLSVNELAEYPAWLGEQQLSPKSITRHVASLKVFFRFVQLEGALTDNQAELLGTQKLWQKVPQVLSIAQVEQLLAAPRKADPWHLRDRAILELLYATGCRVSELATLRLADMHLAERYCICHGKGDKQRIVPLGARAIAAVESYLAAERPQLVERGKSVSDRLILSPRGAGLRRERIWELMKRYAAAGRCTARSAPTRCATVLPRTCSGEVPTYDKFKKCSVTPASPPPRFTLTSITHGSKRCISSFIRERRRKKSRVSRRQLAMTGLFRALSPSVGFEALTRIATPAHSCMPSTERSQSIAPYGECSRRLQVLSCSVASAGPPENPRPAKSGSITPRIKTPHIAPTYTFSEGRLKSSVSGFDEMLGGGIPEGSSTMIAGGAGTGKTLLGIHFVTSAAERGDSSVIVGFQENPAQMDAITERYGWNLKKMKDNNLVSHLYHSPVELQPDIHFHRVREAVDKVDAKLVLIDSLKDIEIATPDKIRYKDYVYSLVNEFRMRGITTLMTNEIPELFGPFQLSEYGVSFMADNVLLLRYVELAGKMSRAINVMKVRGSMHSKDFREFEIDSKGIKLMDPIRAFSGILTGTPSVSETTALMNLPHRARYIVETLRHGGPIDTKDISESTGLSVDVVTHEVRWLQQHRLISNLMDDGTEKFSINF